MPHIQSQICKHLTPRASKHRTKTHHSQQHPASAIALATALFLDPLCFLTHPEFVKKVRIGQETERVKIARHPAHGPASVCSYPTSCGRGGAGQETSELVQIACFDSLDLCWSLSDSDDLWYKSRDSKGQSAPTPRAGGPHLVQSFLSRPIRAAHTSGINDFFQGENAPNAKSSLWQKIPRGSNIFPC